MADTEARQPRGRPRQFDGFPVRVRLSAAVHDELCLEAVRRGIGVSDVVRERLEYFVVQKSHQP